MIKLGILGGSFNPVHKGHIELANYLVDKYIRTGTSGNADSDKAIKTMHDRNAFKLEPVETINFYPF